MSSRTPLKDEIKARKEAILEWTAKKTNNVSNYHPQKKEKEEGEKEKTVQEQQEAVQKQQAEDNARVFAILGPDGYKELHGDTKENLDKISDSTEARTNFIKAISDSFGDDFFATPPITETLYGPTLLDALSVQAKAKGYDLKTLYKEAIQEERNSKAYKNAVFLRSVEVYDGGDFGDKQKVIIISGGSGSGKTSVRPDIVQMVTGAQKSTDASPVDLSLVNGAQRNADADPAKLSEDQHLVVTVDGGIEREVSQVRDLMNETSLKLGFGGVDDLEDFTTGATTGEKLKKTIENAANHKGLHLAIPTTTPTKELKKYMREGTDVSYVIVENTEEVVSVLSRRRAFATIGTPIPKEGDKKPESKKPGYKVVYLFCTLLARYGAYEYAKKQKELKKEPIIIKVKKGLLLVKRKESANGPSFIPCSKRDPKCIVMTQAQLDAWPHANKMTTRYFKKDGKEIVTSILMPGINIEDWPLKPNEKHSKQAKEFKAIEDEINEHIANNNIQKAIELRNSITPEQIYSARYMEEYGPCKQKSKESFSFAPIKSDVPAIKRLQIKQVQKLVVNLESGKLSEKKARLHLRLLRFHTAFTFIDLLNLYKSPALKESSLEWPSSVAAAKLMIKCLDRQEALLKDLETSPENRELILKQVQALKDALPKQDGTHSNMKSVIDKINTIQRLPAPIIYPSKSYSLALPSSVEQYDLNDAKRKLEKVSFPNLLNSVRRANKFYITDEQGAQQRFFFKDPPPPPPVNPNMIEPGIEGLKMEEFIPKLYEFLTGTKLSPEQLKLLPTLITNNDIKSLFKDIKDPNAIIALSEICDPAPFTAAGEIAIKTALFFTENNNTTHFQGGSIRDRADEAHSFIVTKSASGFSAEYSGNVLGITQDETSTNMLQRTEDDTLKTDDDGFTGDPKRPLFTIKASTTVSINPDTGFIELKQSSSFENIPKDKNFQIVLDAEKRATLLQEIENAQQPKPSETAAAIRTPVPLVPLAQPVHTTHSSTTPKPVTVLEPEYHGYPPKPQERRSTTEKMRPLSSVLLTQVQVDDIDKMRDKATIMTTDSGGMKKLECLAGKDPVAVVNAFEVLQMSADKTPIEYILEISGNKLDVSTKDFAINQLMSCGENTKIIGISINGTPLDEKEFTGWVTEAQIKKPAPPAPDPHPHSPHPI